MLELCPNCNQPVIKNVPTCSNHRSSLDLQWYPQNETGQKRLKLEKVNGRNKPTLSLETLTGLVAHVYDVDVKDICSPRNRVNEIVHARRQFIYTATVELNHRRKHVSHFLGQTLSSMSKIVKTERSMLQCNLDIQTKNKRLQVLIGEALSKDPNTS